MLTKIKEFMNYEEFYNKKHEKTIRKYGDSIADFVREYLKGEFGNEKRTVWVNWQEGINNVKPVLITAFVKDNFSIQPCTCIDEYPIDKSNCMSCNMDYHFNYNDRLQEAINDEFGKMTGEKFVVIGVFTDCK